MPTMGFVEIFNKSLLSNFIIILNLCKMSELDKSTRQPFVRTDGIPQTTSYSIIIPPNRDTNGFFRKAYHHEYCKEYISEVEFNDIIDNVCKLASLAYSKKRQNDNRQLSPKVVFVFWICTISVICFCFLSYYAAIDKSNFLRILSIAMLCVSTAMFSLITLSIIFAKIPEFPTLSILVKQRIDNYFNNINQLYTNKGIWWRIDAKYLYIEMVIDEKIPPELKDSKYQLPENSLNASKTEIKKKKTKVEKMTPKETVRSKTSNKVHPIDISAMKKSNLAEKLDDDYAESMTLKSQPMRPQNFNFRGGGEKPSHNNTVFDPFNKGDPSKTSKRINKGQEDEVKRLNEDRKERINFEANNQFQSENPMESIKQDASFDDSKHKRMESPESRLHKTPQDAFPNSPDDGNENYQKEDSMNMDEVSYLENRKESNKDLCNKNARAPDAGYSSVKNQHFNFGENENSNFGTEWMSDNNR